MSVAEKIADALTRFGRPMVLRRLKLGPGGVQIPLDVAVYGYSKNYEPHQLIGSIVQGDSQVTISDAEIQAAQWPGPPLANDKLFIDGKERTLKGVETKFLGVGKLVHVCQVRG